MPDYRRHRVSGGCYFFTVNLLERRGNTLLDERIDVLRDAVRRVRRVRPFIIDAWVGCPITCTPCGRFPSGERGIWQRRFWEHAIRGDADYAADVDYVHFNPVKHGLVAAPAEWPYSTFKSCVGRGLYPLDWIGGSVHDVPTGEPGR
jgi:REP-associated tyrosine transposase